MIKTSFRVAAEGTAEMAAMQEHAVDIFKTNTLARTDMILANMESSVLDRFNRTLVSVEIRSIDIQLIVHRN